MKIYVVKIFDNKNKHLDTLKVEYEGVFGIKAQNDLIGYCRIFIHPKSELIEVIGTTDSF